MGSPTNGLEKCTGRISRLYGTLPWWFEGWSMYTSHWWHSCVQPNIWGSCWSRLHELGVKLKQKKCRLFKQEVNYLGQIVSAAGYRLDQSSVEAVGLWRTVSLAQLVKWGGYWVFFATTAGISRILLGLPTQSSSCCRQLLKMWPNQHARPSKVSIMARCHLLDQWCDGRVLKHCWTTLYLLQFLAIPISVSPWYCMQMHHKRD